jgi:hypothetical protein
MGDRSILAQTLLLFGVAVLGAGVAIALVLWVTMRRAKRAASRPPV